MKTFLVALTLILFSVMGIGQEPIVPPEILQLFHGGYVESDTLPDIGFNEAMLISILADYDLYHEEKLMNSKNYWGMTSTNNQTLFVSKVPSRAIRREAVIHEALHAAYYEFGIETADEPYETQIQRLAHAYFLKLYGVKGKDNASLSDSKTEKGSCEEGPRP